MVRFVAVAIDDHDITGRNQRLNGHLIGRGRSVGYKEDVVGAEGACSHLLGLLDVTGWFQKTVQAAGGGAALGQEKRLTVELAHVADPVRLENRFAARNRSEEHTSELQ